MKTNALIQVVIIMAAGALHLAPAIGIVMIAVGEETTRALGAVLLCSLFPLGFWHGKNDSM